MRGAWAHARVSDRAGPDRPRAIATVRIAFRSRNVVGARNYLPFAAQWLAYASPCRRFVADLAIGAARLGAGVVRVTFTVKDFHLLLLAGLPAHPRDRDVYLWCMLAGLAKFQLGRKRRGGRLAAPVDRSRQELSELTFHSGGRSGASRPAP